MAAKAYVVSMTVTELKEELKQRGLSTRGSKKSLRDRLEQALYDEELDDPSSESESEGAGQNLMFGGQSGFNFEVPPESFIAEEDIVPDDDEDDPDYCEPMIVSVQLSDRERLKVCPRASATPGMPVGIEDRSMGDRSLEPMIVAIELGNRNMLSQNQEHEIANTTSNSGEDLTRPRREAPLLAEPVAVIKTTALEAGVHTVNTSEPAPLVAKGQPVMKRRKSADSAVKQEASAPVAVINEVGGEAPVPADVSTDIPVTAEVCSDVPKSADVSSVAPKSADVSINGNKDVERMELSDSVDNVSQQEPEQQQEPTETQAEQKIQQVSGTGDIEEAQMHNVEESVAPPTTTPPTTEDMTTESQATTDETTPLINTGASADNNRTSEQDSNLSKQEQQLEQPVSGDGALQMEAEAEKMEDNAQDDEPVALTTTADDVATTLVMEEAPEIKASVELEDWQPEPELERQDTSEQLVPEGDTSQEEGEAMPQPASDEVKSEEQPAIVASGQVDSVTSTSESHNVVQEQREDTAVEDETEKQSPSAPADTMAVDRQEPEDEAVEQSEANTTAAQQEHVEERDVGEELANVDEERETADSAVSGGMESEQINEAETAPTEELTTQPFPSEAEGDRDEPSEREIQKKEDNNDDEMEVEAEQKSEETPPSELTNSPPPYSRELSSQNIPTIVVSMETSAASGEEEMDVKPTPSQAVEHDTPVAEKQEETISQQPEFDSPVPEQQHVDTVEELANVEEERETAQELEHEMEQRDKSEVPEQEARTYLSYMEMSESTFEIEQSSVIVEPPSPMRDELESELTLSDDFDNDGDVISSEGMQEEAAAIDEDTPVVSSDHVQEQEENEGEMGIAPVISSEPFHEEETAVDSLEPTREEPATADEFAPVVSSKPVQELEEKEEIGVASVISSEPSHEEETAVDSSEPTREEPVTGDEVAPVVSSEPVQEEEGGEMGITSSEPSHEEETAVDSSEPTRDEPVAADEVAPVVGSEPIQEEEGEGEMGVTPVITSEPSHEEETGVESSKQTQEEMITPDEVVPVISSELPQEEGVVSDKGDLIVSSEPVQDEEAAKTFNEDVPAITSEPTDELEGAAADERDEVALVVSSKPAEDEEMLTQQEVVGSESIQYEEAAAIEEAAPVISSEPMDEEHGTLADVDLRGDEQIEESITGSTNHPHQPLEEHTSTEPSVQNPDELVEQEEGTNGVEKEETQNSMEVTPNPAKPDEETSQTSCDAEKEEEQHSIEVTANPDKLATPDEETSLTSGDAEKEKEEGQQQLVDLPPDPDKETSQTGDGSGEKKEGEGEVEVSRESGGLLLESGPIEVDVLLHAEEDDLSVFSAEAAEADKALTLSSSSSTRRKKPQTASSSSSSTANSRQRRSSKSSLALVSPSLGEARVATSYSSSGPSASSAVSATASGSVGNRRVSVSSSSGTEAASGGGGGEKRARSEKSEVSGDPPSIKRRRISAHGSSSSGNKDSSTSTSCVGGTGGSGQERKRRWGKQRSNSSSAANISSDVLKDIIPADVEALMNEDQIEVGVANLGEVELSGEGEEPSHNGDDLTAEEREWERVKKEREQKNAEQERARHELETRRRIESRLKAKQEADAKSRVMHRTPSPARNLPSCILHVDHLTRPFTKSQLHELLTKDGEIVKEAFWTNRIRSQCIALYEKVETAVATRARLHGLKWPSTNSKFLAVDYLTPEEASRISEGQLEVKPFLEGGASEAGEAGEVVKMETADTKQQAPEESSLATEAASKPHPQEEKKPIEDHQHLKQRRHHDDITDESKPQQERERVGDRTEKQRKASQDRDREREGRREERDGERGEREEEKMEEETVEGEESVKEIKATKLLDDLFRKTKATPCIYWLPLTDAQVAENEAEEKAREEEREKRRQERMRLRQEEREREEKEREKRLAVIRERRARERERDREREKERERERRERARRRSRSRSRSRNRSRSRSKSRSRSRDRRRR